MSVSRSFDNVDFKLAEADFFLQKIQSSSLELFECNFHFSAFLSAARSVTFALQAVMTEVDGFADWYEQQQEVLRTSETALRFKNLRNECLKTGDLPVTGGSFNRGKVTLFLTLPDGRSSADQVDAIAAATDYMRRLVKLVFECYAAFGPVIDAEQHYSAKNLKRTGRTIDDVDEELFGIRGWTSGVQDAERLRLLRQSQPGCRVDYLFERYLGQKRPRPA